MYKYILIIVVFAFLPDMKAMHNDDHKFLNVEYHFCSFKEGMGMNDLMKSVKKFNSFLKQNSSEQSYQAALLVAKYDMDSEYDYIWYGAWPSRKAKAMSLDNWNLKGSDINNEFGAISECDSASGYQYVARDGGNQASSSPAPVYYRWCNMNEGVTRAEVRETVDEWNNVAVKAGYKGSSRIFYPMIGTRTSFDADTIFVDIPGSHMNEHHNWELRRENPQWWEKTGPKFDEQLTCSDNTVQYEAIALTN